jgi:predicted flap endonuclease-1-like 5' DNA nuclease
MSLSIFSNQNTGHLFELFLWMLGAFLIGWFFWRWWYKNKCENEINEWKSKFEDLEHQQNTTIKAKKVAAPGVTKIQSANFVHGVAKVDDSVKEDLKKVKKSKPKSKSKSKAKPKAKPKAVAKEKVDSVKDDLKKVEGIGPKIQDLFNNDGIWSFKQLSNAKVNRLKKILEDAGPRYRIHTPETWPEQAKMAAEGKWEALKIWQDNHKGGRKN